MASNRVIVAIEHTRERAQEMASYCRAAGNERGQDRHPRIHKRQVRAELVAIVVYVVVADAVPLCPIRSSLGEACVKPEKHKGRCCDKTGNIWWGEGKPENREGI